jgi:hypothetical protein
MPIGKEEWDSACKSDTFEKRILSFLRKNRDNVYTLPEIVSALGIVDRLVGMMNRAVANQTGFGVSPRCCLNERVSLSSRRILLPPRIKVQKAFSNFDSANMSVILIS